MKACFCATLAGLILLAHPALAKQAQASRQTAAKATVKADVQYAQSHYDYRSASSVREAFDHAPSHAKFWPGHDGHPGHHSFHSARRGDRVVEHLTGDFTGGVGYGTNGDVGFVDGYGQIHFYAGFQPRIPFGRPVRPGMTFGHGFMPHR